MNDKLKLRRRATVPQARALRRKQTLWEKKLWQRIRNRKLGGYKFKRQHPIGPYILDFYCFERRVAVEVDGGGHDREDQRKHDALRTEYLAREHVQVLRFGNAAVRENLDGVVETIRMALEQKDVVKEVSRPRQVRYPREASHFYEAPGLDEALRLCEALRLDEAPHPNPLPGGEGEVT